MSQLSPSRPKSIQTPIPLILEDKTKVPEPGMEDELTPENKSKYKFISTSLFLIKYCKQNTLQVLLTQASRQITWMKSIQRTLIQSNKICQIIAQIIQIYPATINFHMISKRDLKTQVHTPDQKETNHVISRFHEVDR